MEKKHEEINIKINYKKIEDNIIEELILTLNKMYVELGNVEEVVKMSQELDKYILIEQKKNLKILQNNNMK